MGPARFSQRQRTRTGGPAILGKHVLNGYTPAYLEGSRS